MIAKDKLHFLDALRGVAILVVYMFHCATEVYGGDWIHWRGLWRDWEELRLPGTLFPLTYGWAGVAVFFVISGFCIHLSWRRNSVGGIKAFYARRFFRVYPPYFLALCLFTIMVLWRGAPLRETATQLATHAGLVHNAAGRWFFGINPSFWSIAVEWQLYLLYPILLWMVKHSGWRTTLGIVGLVEVGMRFLASYEGVVRNQDLPVSLSTGLPMYYWFSWTLGAVLAEIYLKGGKLPLLRIPAWFFPLLFVASSFFRPLNHFGFLFAALWTTQAMSRMLDKNASPESAGDIEKPDKPGWMDKYFKSTGVVSYSIYLIHQPILALIAETILSWSAMDSLAMRQILGLSACALAWFPIHALSRISYRYVELISVDMGRKWISSRFPAKPHSAN